MRSAARKMSYTRDRATGLAETILTVPLTRGSSTKFFPVISPTALTTPSMSALTKLSVTRSASADHAGPMQTAMASHKIPVRNQQRCISPLEHLSSADGRTSIAGAWRSRYDGTAFPRPDERLAHPAALEYDVIGAHFGEAHTCFDLPAFADRNSRLRVDPQHRIARLGARGGHDPEQGNCRSPRCSAVPLDAAE